MNSRSNSAKKSGSKQGSAVKEVVEPVRSQTPKKADSNKASKTKEVAPVVEAQTPKKAASNKASKSKDTIEVVHTETIIKKSASGKKGAPVEEVEVIENDTIEFGGLKKSIEKREKFLVAEEQVAKAISSAKKSKGKESVPAVVEEKTPQKAASGKASNQKEQTPKNVASAKTSKGKAAPVEEEEGIFKALYNKKGSTPTSNKKKPVEIEEEEDDEDLDDEIDMDEADLIEEEGEEGVDDFGDDEPLPEGVADILGDEDDDEFGDEEGEELDEEEMGEAQPRQGFIGFNLQPAPEDEYAFDKPPDDKKLKIMGLDKNNAEVDMALIRMKIEDTLKILAHFKDMKDPVRSRQSYLEEMKENLCTYYGYNSELIELFMNTFSPGECVQFLEANEHPRPSTIRTNTLKTNRKHLAQILMQRGVSLEPLAEWSKVGIKIFESKVPIGATPEYLAGHYMLQSASSFLPVIALAPQMGERVLDMAAAPGGKTTYIAQLMKNTGILMANDAKLERLKSLKFNLQRMGVTNAMVTNYDGRKLPGVMKGFDRILLDAPCTGLGIIAKDHSIKSSRMLIDVKKMSHLQKELLSAAIDCCKPGGYIVYSTCSVTVEENEWVVDYALKNRFVKLVETGVEVGEEGYTKYADKKFDPSLKLTKRIYPHIHNMDGFYFAKFRKLQNGSKKVEEAKAEESKKAKSSKVTEKLNKKQKAKQAHQEVPDEDDEDLAIQEEDEDEENFEDQEEEEEEEVPVPAPKKGNKNDKKGAVAAPAKVDNKKKDAGKGKRKADVEVEDLEDEIEEEVKPQPKQNQKKQAAAAPQGQQQAKPQQAKAQPQQQAQAQGKPNANKAQQNPRQQQQQNKNFKKKKTQ